MVPKTVYLMCGPSFSGKTTLAKAIAASDGIAVISLDRIQARRGLSGGFAIPASEWRRAHEIAIGELDAALSGGVAGAVVDDTNCFRFLRDAYREVAERHGFRCVAVVMAVPREEVLRRAREEAEESRRRGVGLRELERQIDEFEWPGKDEDSLRFGIGNDPAAFAAALTGSAE